MSKKLLPKPDRKHLFRDYGYGVHKSESTRRKAIREVVNELGGDKDAVRSAQAHLNLIRNITADPYTKQITSEDVDYLKRMYAREKAKEEQSGGASVGKTFFISNNYDYKIVHEFVKKILQVPISLENIKVIVDSGVSAGMTLNGELLAYAVINTSDGSNAMINFFLADVGQGTKFLTQLEEYLSRKKINSISYLLNLKTHYSITEINWWFTRGYKAKYLTVDNVELVVGKMI